MFMVCPSLLEVICMPPLTCSESTASSLTLPLDFIPPEAHSMRISCLLPVEVTTTREQELVAWSAALKPFSRSLAVMQVLLTVGLDPLLACIMACILARCSGVNLLSTSSGMGGIPVVCPLTVVSHWPVFTSRVRKSAAQTVEQNNMVSPIETLVVTRSPHHLS